MSDQLRRQLELLQRANALLESAIREADQDFMNGYPGRCCARIRDTRIHLDKQAVAA